MTSRFDVRSRRLARALRQQTLLTVCPSATCVKKVQISSSSQYNSTWEIFVEKFMHLQSICCYQDTDTLNSSLLLDGIFSWSEYKKYFSWKLYATNITISITFYGSWISATIANYNYNITCNTLLTQTETGRAVAVSTKGVLYYAVSNQEH